MYIRRFQLPGISREENILLERCIENGGSLTAGYIDNPYPIGIFPRKDFDTIDFTPITIFYGGNGSGKTTLLNIISQKLGLERISPFNSSEVFDQYAACCTFVPDTDDNGEDALLPAGSRIITSDDVFEYMLTLRSHNDEILEDTQPAKDLYQKIRNSAPIPFSGMQDYEDFRLQLMAKDKHTSRRKFIQNTVGTSIKTGSNGETAMDFFATRLEDYHLYCLDEPENSLSPKLQLELKDLLEDKAHYLGCQLIISTHSPFLLALNEDLTTIYDLDHTPIRPRKWWELENTRTYFEFFDKHRKLFE